MTQAEMSEPNPDMNRVSDDANALATPKTTTENPAFLRKNRGLARFFADPR
jgi:hypothetical protein